MHYGVVMFPTDYAIRPDDLARAVEQRGFESLWVPEHTHIPASRKSPWPGGPNLPQEYWHSHDPFVALAMAAAVTSTLKLGTGICLVIERDPITLAKEVASLDHLSRGRFLFGIGGGWNAEEMEHHGTPFKSRWKVLRERMLAMKELWTKEEAEYHGEYVRFEKSWAYPKPVQKPHPPILMGGDGPTTFDRVVEFCDGWMPIAGRGMSALPEKIATLQKRAKEAGRGRIPVTAFMPKPERGVMDALESAGVERVVLGLPSDVGEKVLPLLDGYAKLMR